MTIQRSQAIFVIALMVAGFLVSCLALVWFDRI
jgi:hypothetical protein